MTVVVETPYAERAWTGVETQFTPGFSAGAVTDVSVAYKDGSGTISDLTANIHFSVLIDGTGAVTILPVALPASPGTLLIQCDTPSEQPTTFDLSTPPDTYEQRFDDAARRTAELAYQLTRRLAFNRANTAFDAGGKTISSIGAAGASTDAISLGEVQALIAALGAGPAGPAGNNLFTALTETLKTADYTVQAGDRGGLLIANKATAITFGMPAVATLAAYVYFFGNIGAGALTIDGDGAEVVDAMLGGSAASIVLDTGDTAMLIGNGTLWRAFLWKAEGNRAAETSIASAATCDIGALNTEAVTITGTTGIGSFGARPRKLRRVRFQGILTLTNGAGLALLGAADRTTTAGAIGTYASDASGNWRELSYSEGDATAFMAAYGLRAEPTSQIYRAGAGDIRAKVLGTDVLLLGQAYARVAVEAQLDGELSFGGVNAPGSLSAGQNNLALPAGVSSVEYTSSADISITGFVAPTRRRRIVVINANAGGGKNITIPQESASSTAANRVKASGDADVVLYPGTSCVLDYSLTAARWRVTRAPEFASASDIWAAKKGKIVTAEGFSASQAFVALSINGGTGSALAGVTNGINFELGITNEIGQNFTFILTGGNSKIGQSGVVRFKQGNPVRTITWDGSIVFPGGVKPALTATAAHFDDLFYTVMPGPVYSCSLAKDVK